MPGEDVEVTATYENISHIHAPSETWSKDAAQHWRMCTASDGYKMDEASHNFGNWVIDKAATETETGSKHRICTVCAYSAVEEIPAIGKVPVTGDTDNVYLWVALMMTALCALAFPYIRKRHNANHGA